MTLTIANLTTNIATSATNVVTGDGVFDDLMETANAHMDAQFKLGRITGTDYATVYLGVMQTVIQQAAAYVLGQEKTNADVVASTATTTRDDTKSTADIVALVAQSAALTSKTAGEVSLLAQKEVTEFAQTGVATNTAPTAGSIMGAQSLLYAEQAKGFKWNADQKYLKTLLDAWSVNTSTAGVPVTGITALNATGTGNMNTQITNAEPTP